MSGKERGANSKGRVVWGLRVVERESRADGVLSHSGLALSVIRVALLHDPDLAG